MPGRPGPDLSERYDCRGPGLNCQRAIYIIVTVNLFTIVNFLALRIIKYVYDDNTDFLEKIFRSLKKGGIIILNSDLINSKFSFGSVRGICLPLNKIAFECGNVKVANVVALGALLFLDPNIFKKETLVNGLKATFKNQNTLKQNLRALDMGQVLASENKEENKCQE